MTKPNLKTFTEVFMAKLIPCFRPPTDDAKNAKLMIEAYSFELSKFDVETLDDAAREILTKRKDPFFPTLAECIEVCDRIARRKAAKAHETKTARTEASRMAADGWEFVPGDQ